MATPSKSRMSTAICARFAASATRLKSRRKGEAVSVGLCGGGAGCWTCWLWVWGAEVGPVDVADEEDEED